MIAWPPRIRARLTVLYGLLIVVSGAVLLAITYLLVSHAPRTSVVTRVSGPVHGGPGPAPPLKQDDLARLHAAELHRLLVRSGIALAIMVVIALLLGWIVSGRILRPLRTMITSIRQISAHNVHDRLAAAGPRDELKDLSDTVDGLLERLEAALDAQKRFVANAAHELRTPLTLEHALIEETLIDRHATPGDYRSTLERLLVLRRRQATMLESLLALAGSERGLARREPVDVAELARRTVAAYRPAAGRADVRVETDIRPASATGDPELVERLIANLVDNAIGYNVAGGRVLVTASGLALTVTNTGPLVPADRVDTLFEPFQRLDRTTGRPGHHGLGLSIVRAIAAAHGGTIKATPNTGGGLRIEVRFGAPSRTPEARVGVADGPARSARARAG